MKIKMQQSYPAYSAILAFFFVSFAAHVDATDPVKTDLAPNADVDLQFPQLPDTFFTMKTGTKVPPQLAARLPSNYSTDRKFPLFVFLAGGDGGDAGKDSVGGPRTTIGDTDYISVTLPLFKKSIDPHSTMADVISPELLAGLPPALLGMVQKMPASGIVTQGDYDVIRSSYAVMLQKLFETIPNIDPDRSVMAGFSNGAHTIGVLLAAKDPFVLQHFHSFCLIEGGMGMAFDPKKTVGPELKDHRLLILMGDGAGPKDEKGSQAMARPFATQLMKNFNLQAAQAGIDCSLVTMQNTDHSFSLAYRPNVRQWARGGSAENAPMPAVTPPVETK